MFIIQTNSRGIALGPILFLIAIVAIIAAVIAAGSGEFSPSTNSEGGKISAHAIIDFMDQVGVAVQMVQSNGSCTTTQFRFENTNTTMWNSAGNYNNPNAPGDSSCDIFNPTITGLIAGGGLNWINPNPNWLTLWPNPYNGYMYTGSFAVYGVGSCQTGSCTSYSLAVLLPYVTVDICNAVNAAVGISVSNYVNGSTPSPSPPQYANGAGFEGVYGGYPISIGNTNSPAYYGHRVGCYLGAQVPSHGTGYPYVVYDIILPL
ncbi:MAG: hypothetical protein JO126_04185 [Alphaproteobacteria bacterium]|nr:hypothetical protein [Alphaproteobacteria bacterium]